MRSLPIVVALSVATAMAADVTGIWSGKTPEGTALPDSHGSLAWEDVVAVVAIDKAGLMFVFNVKGTKLTGKVSPVYTPNPLNIKNGKVEGDSLSFSTTESVVSPRGVSQLSINYTGDISADGKEIRLKEDIFVGGKKVGATIEYTVKKIP